MTSPATGHPDRRSTVVAVLTLVGIAAVVIGTFLPIITYEFGDVDLPDSVEDSASGWGDGFSDGPIHAFVAALPLVVGIIALQRGLQTWMKVVLLLAPVVGFFWAAVRFADISGSLEDDSGAGELVAAFTDPGVGLYVLTIGWGVVFVAGILSLTVRRSVPASV